MPQVLRRPSPVTADGAPHLTEAPAGSRPGHGGSGTAASPPAGFRQSSRPGRRPGRLRARFCRLLPALAVLAGAFGLLTAGPALAQSSDSTLRALTVEVSTDGVNFNRVSIHPEFSAAQGSYDTVVMASASHTHVRVTATANHVGATLQVGKVVGGRSSLTSATSGSPSGAIALVDGANQIRIRVNAQDGVSGQSYFVTVTRGGQEGPPPPRHVKVTAGTAKLTLAWTAPVYWGSYPAGGYEVDWYAGASPPMDDSDWNPATPTPAPLAATATSYEFTGTYGDHTVADGTTYQLRIRAFGTNPNDAGDYLVSDWVVVAGTPPSGSSRSSDARLSALAAGSATSATGTFQALTLTPSAFSAATTEYTASVANDRTHVKLTPTVNETNATVKVGKQGTTLSPVTSGTASASIALNVGANAITVRVTAQDGTAMKDYTVTVTRRQAQSTPPSGVTLSADNATPVEGASVTVTATLDAAAPASGVTLTLEVLARVSGTIYSTATATDDYTLSPATISISQGQTTGTATLATVDDAAVEDTHYSVAGETVVLRASSTTPALASQPLVVTILDNDGPFANRRAGAPTLAAVTSGDHAPTATALAFTVGCVSGGGAPITDYVLWAENVADASDWHSQRFAPSGPPGCATFGPVTMTGLPGRSSATTYRVRAYARSITGFRTPWSQPVEVATPAEMGQVLGNGGGEEAEPRAALTASFEGAPAEHDGRAFTFDLRFSEALGAGGKAPARASFTAVQGRVESVSRVEAGLWRVRVKPVSWRDVTVTLRGGRECAALYAVCTADGRALENSPDARVGGPARIETRRSMAREGRDDSMRFWVRLSRAAAHAVTVDWTTADGRGTWARIPPAAAGADYSAASGRLTFAPGETRKTVSVPILDDAVDEGTEYFLLRFSNPQGGYLEAGHRERQGLIRNDDPLQRMWLARFGRTVGSQVADAVSERLAGGLAPGAHMTLAGQPLDLGKAGDGTVLADAMTGLAQRFGAPGGPADDPGSGASAPARSITGQDLLLGSSFHVAGTGESSGPVLAAWGRVAQAGFDGEEASDGGRTSIDGEVLTGTLGADADWGRVLAGVAVSLSEGEGGFDQPGVDKGSIESALTTVSPYAQVKVNGRVSAWSLLGWGTGDMTITQDAREATGTRPARAGTVTKTDISMQMGAVGARGALMEQDGAGGMDLALKADAFFVRMDSEKAAGSAETTTDASRLRLVLEGGRAFTVGGSAVLRPSLELGVRHDGGDAETGTGVEIGAGVAYADPSSGLSLEAKARTLVAHADSDYREWGASAVARLDPGERGRGLSFSLAPVIGSATSARERLWGAHDAHGLAPAGSGFEATRGLTAEAGYGLALSGDRFTGTPNLGLRMSDGGARDWRIGWRLAPAVRGRPGFAVSLDATRREPANGNGPVDHGVILKAAVRW